VKSRSELILLTLILIGCLLVGGAIGSYMLSDSNANRRKGDPNDVTSFVPKALLLGSSSLERGASPARFTLVEFGDFQCTSCARAESMIRELISKRGDTRLIYRHFPIPSEHQYAEIAAHAMEVAKEQGKGWEMHDALFDHQLEWSTSDDVPEALAGLARSIGLEPNRFRIQLKSSVLGSIAARLTRDRSDGLQASVPTTPSFFLITPTHTWAAVGPIGLERLSKNSKYWE
jgi:protein-disulfide isomerase